MTIQWKTKIQGPIAVIGDLHGQADKLEVVLDRLRQTPGFQNRWVVFIGDFVDRGPDSKGVIDMVLDFMAEHPATTAIMGNHEFAMCSALGWLSGSEASSWGKRWTTFYNAESTFASYGAEVGNLEDLAAKIPAEHRELLSTLPWCVEHPELLFVHAGLDPTMPFKVQLRILHEKDFTLNRPQWLCEKLFVHQNPPADCPLTVVSGHVKVPSVVLRPRRILVDTTGGEKGNLSCVLLPERQLITSAKSISSGGRDGVMGKLTGAKWWKFWGSSKDEY
ncbi:metallophosphoesterase [Schlesneria sp. T3-172]|uniref:metallophosphoesterase n=2 Tax=Schlesneria TaxID=656899 RepID=UPI0037C9A812